MTNDLNTKNYSENELFILIGIENPVDRTKEKIKENIQTNLVKAEGNKEIYSPTRDHILEATL